jgi:hypothetical protein
VVLAAGYPFMGKPEPAPSAGRATRRGAPAAPGNGSGTSHGFIGAVEPVQKVLVTLVDAEPDGELADVPACLINTAAQLGFGDVVAEGSVAWSKGASARCTHRMPLARWMSRSMIRA